MQSTSKLLKMKEADLLERHDCCRCSSLQLCFSWMQNKSLLVERGYNKLITVINFKVNKL